ncbi:25420_t:CDS:2 [Dentiscutata erythropus]|uniref:25420_t:CDS:1 n=1 Tax=Dentiscutata erythropus TaxID=1348616 RepID=A0A9N8YYU6_9GLOM|nr:25420_t:CDS:2 [Dentiscutata erythropus]
MQQIASQRQQRKQVKQRRKHFNNNTERTAPNPNDVTRTTNEWNHTFRNSQESLSQYHKRRTGRDDSSNDGNDDTRTTAQ